MVPLVVHSKFSYALMVMNSLRISSSVYPAFLMNFKVQIFRVDPLSIMTRLMKKSETMTTM